MAYTEVVKLAYLKYVTVATGIGLYPRSEQLKHSLVCCDKIAYALLATITFIDDLWPYHMAVYHGE